MTRRLALIAALLPLAAFAQDRPFPLPPPEWPKPVNDTQVIPYLLIDRLEYRASNGPDSTLWDVQGWIGGDYNKAWIKAEGHKENGGRTEEATIDALYARRIAPFWYVQGGARSEERPGPRRTGAVVGIQGIAPYWFDVESDLFVRGGEVELRFEAENDLFLGQRLILQPRFETKVVSRADPERGFGRGFRSVDVGLRLRYEIRREFAPYIGVSWVRQLGETADFARAEGRNPRETAFVAGVRIWY